MRYYIKLSSHIIAFTKKLSLVKIIYRIILSTFVSSLLGINTKLCFRISLYPFNELIERKRVKSRGIRNRELRRET